MRLTDDEIRTWREMSRKMFVPFHADGIISQFEGYEDLQELDGNDYRSRHGNIQRLDRILRAEGDNPDRYKLSKQADTVMLFFLFSQDELGRLFEQLGYEYTDDTARRTIEYYDRRTSHGSTLSFVTHAGVLAAIDPDSSWQLFLAAVESDINDIQGGTTREGIHLGVMAGTLDLVQRAYLGTQIRDDVVYFNPTLPDRLDELSLSMQMRHTPLTVSLHGSELTVAALADGHSGPIRVGVGDAVRELAAARAPRSRSAARRGCGMTAASARVAPRGRASGARSSTSTACSSTCHASGPGATATPPGQPYAAARNPLRDDAVVRRKAAVASARSIAQLTRTSRRSIQ